MLNLGKEPVLSLRLSEAAVSQYQQQQQQQQQQHQQQAFQQGQTLADVFAAAPLDSRYQDGNTVLHCAVLLGHLEIVKGLMQRGANPAVENYCGMTCLHLAAWTGFVDAITLFVASGLVHVDYQNEEGVCALHSAAVGGQLGAVCELLKRGACPMMKDSDGRIPAFHAILEGHNDVLKAFLTNWQDVALSSDAQGTSLLHAAASCGNVQATTDLLEAGANVNAQDDSKDTPLHAAVVGCRADIVRILLENGASADALNSDLETPLHLACQLNTEDCVLALVEFCDASTIGRNAAGYLPFQLTSSKSIQDLLPAQASIASEAMAIPSASAARAPSATLVLQLGQHQQQQQQTRVSVKVAVIRRPLDDVVLRNHRAVQGFALAVTPSLAMSDSVVTTSSARRIVVEAVLIDVEGGYQVVEKCLRNNMLVVEGNNMADFAAMEFWTRPGKYLVQFNAYQNYGRSDQRMVGFSEPTMVNVVDSPQAVKEASFFAMMAQTGVQTATLSPKTIMAWTTLAFALQAHFTRVMRECTRQQKVRGLSVSDLAYCKERVSSCMDGENIRLEDFHDQVWSWIYAVEQTIACEARVKEMWQSGYIMGFSKRDQASKVLEACPPGVCLVRFSENTPGALTIGVSGKQVTWTIIDTIHPERNLADFVLQSKLLLIAMNGVVVDPPKTMSQWGSGLASSSYVNIVGRV